MLQYFIAFLVALIGTIALGVQSYRFNHIERKYIWASYGAHVFSALALIWITKGFFGGGDIFLYQRGGLLISEKMQQEFGYYFIEAIKLFLQLDSNISGIVGAGHSTGSVAAITGILMFFLGNSFYAASMVVSLFAFSGQIATYMGLRDLFPVEYKKRLLTATLLIPSVVFWSSGMLKETIAMIGLGWLFFVTIRFCYKQFKIIYLLPAIVGAILIANTKAYILPPYLIASSAAIYWQRAGVTGQRMIRIKPFTLAMAALATVVGIVVIGELFPRFSLSNIGESAAYLQEVAPTIEGGSNISMGAGNKRSLTGQLGFAPWALITALFRPFIFEVHNIMSLINALETTVIAWLFYKVIRARSIKKTMALLSSSPALVFCAVFVLLFAVGVGLTSMNLGTLSRYRIPMMPFYGVLLLMLLPMPKRQRLVPVRRATIPMSNAAPSPGYSSNVMDRDR